MGYSCAAGQNRPHPAWVEEAENSNQPPKIGHALTRNNIAGSLAHGRTTKGLIRDQVSCHRSSRYRVIRHAHSGGHGLRYVKILNLSLLRSTRRNANFNVAGSKRKLCGLAKATTKISWNHFAGRWGFQKTLQFQIN